MDYQLAAHGKNTARQTIQSGPLLDSKIVKIKEKILFCLHNLTIIYYLVQCPALVSARKNSGAFCNQSCRYKVPQT